MSLIDQQMRLDLALIKHLLNQDTAAATNSNFTKFYRDSAIDKIFEFTDKYRNIVTGEYNVVPTDESR